MDLILLRRASCSSCFLLASLWHWLCAVSTMLPLCSLLWVMLCCALFAVVIAAFAVVEHALEALLLVLLAVLIVGIDVLSSGLEYSALLVVMVYAGAVAVLIAYAMLLLPSRALGGSWLSTGSVMGLMAVFLCAGTMSAV